MRSSRQLLVGTSVALLLLACIWAVRRARVVEPFVPHRHEVRQEAYWKHYALRFLPLGERVHAPPPELLSYLRLENERSGFGGRPSAPPAGDAFEAELAAAIGELPPRVRELASTGVFGIFPVRGLGSTGYSDTVLDREGRPIGAFVVLDASALERGANDWATWKESSPFVPESPYAVRATIANTIEDTPRAAITWMLLHELAHVIGLIERIHPAWQQSASDVPDVESFAFTKLSWRSDPTRGYASVWDSWFPLRPQVRFYVGADPELKAGLAPAVYEQLEKTDFVTLYGSTNPFDDFAEAFASYVHSSMLGRPYSVNVNEGNRLVRQFTLCWGKPRCESKRRILQRLLGSPRSG